MDFDWLCNARKEVDIWNMFAKNKGAYEQEIINAEDASFRANDATGFGSAVGDLFGV